MPTDSRTMPLGTRGVSFCTAVYAAIALGVLVFTQGTAGAQPDHNCNGIPRAQEGRRLSSALI